MRVAISHTGRWVITGIVALIVVASATTPAGAEGRCAVAEVPEMFVLPDGAVHGPGTLKVCLTKAYSPVAGLHRTYRDGRPTGLFLSRLGIGEGPDESGRPYFLFSREGRGPLVLQAYAWPYGDELRTYAVTEPPAFARKRALRVEELRAASAGRAATGKLVFLLASN